jgi:hypothetical protein
MAGQMAATPADAAPMGAPRCAGAGARAKRPRAAQPPRPARSPGPDRPQAGGPGPTPAPSVSTHSVTYVLTQKCYPCLDCAPLSPDL